MFIEKFYKDLQTFIYKNKLLSASSSFIFGMISKDYIDKILNEIILPLFLSIVSFNTIIKEIEKEYPIIYILLKLVWYTIIWILTIFISFFIIEYILNRNILGLSSTVITKEEKSDYIDMKVDAKVSGIIPDKSELKEIEREKETVERKINERYMNVEEYI